MRVGIVTFHFAQNHGAMLQAYALQQKLTELGHEASVIDYRPRHHTELYRRFQWRKILSWNPYRLAKRLTVELLLYPTYRRRAKAFTRFEQEHYHLAPYHTEQSFSDYDVVVCGSDQIWDVNFLKDTEVEGLYFGDGIDCPVISYAASYSTPFAGNQLSKMQAKLQNFSAISVREKSVREELQPLTDQVIHHVLDPVLLAGSKWFLPFSEQRPEAQKYLFVYQVVGVEGAYQQACRFAAQRGLKVIYMQSYLSIHHTQDADQAASPEKLVAYIRHAEYVFSTSFHGTAFSILFHKPFYCLLTNSHNDCRSLSLLNLLGLSDRIIDTQTDPQELPIDYEVVDQKLAQERATSEQFLKEALLQATDRKVQNKKN